MRTYLRAFLIGGVVIPVVLHLMANREMPWWPDTVSLGIGFGVFAVLMVSKTRKDREASRRLWHTIKDAAHHGFKSQAR